MRRSPDTKIFLEVERSVLGTPEDFSSFSPPQQKKQKQFARILPEENSFIKDGMELSALDGSLNDSELPSIILPREGAGATRIFDDHQDKQECMDGWGMFAEPKQGVTEDRDSVPQQVPPNQSVRAIRFEVQDTGSFIQK